MKFAVVEYESKSGAVWRHRDARPNYLADPQHEIDPTSFGCYVSALKGEHVPLTGLIVGPVNPVSAPLRWWRKGIKRLTSRWPATYDLRYLRTFDTLLFVHQLADAPELTRALTRLRRARGGAASGSLGSPLILGVPTQPYGRLKQAVTTSPGARTSLIDFIRYCDSFISVVKSTVPWYARLAGVPITYLPQPYPVQFARRSAQPRSSKESVIMVAGVTQRYDIRLGQRIAAALNQKLPSYRIVVPKLADLTYDASDLSDTPYALRPFEPWRQHLSTLARATLVINTDYTETRGRVQCDCAAVGTPSLGGNSDGAVDLWPDLASRPDTPFADLVARGERLLTDQGYYEAVTRYAADRLVKYDYEESAARLQLHVRTISRRP